MALTSQSANAVVGTGTTISGIGNNVENLKIDSVHIDSSHTTTTNIVKKTTHHHHAPPDTRQPLKDLHSHVVAGAMHNSDERCDAPKCHPETRTAVQDEILSWVSQGDADAGDNRVKWVTGPAGTGKTAIMGSLSDTCEQRGDLAATFFFSSFSKSEGRRSKKGFVTTLAYQLFQHQSLSEIRPHLLASVDADPAIFRKRLDVQLEHLILRPLRATRQDRKGDAHRKPKVIIIDGLDECEAEQYHDPNARVRKPSRSKEEDQTEILSILILAVADPNFPFRVIIASRPEPAIRRFFNGPGLRFTTDLFLDEKYSPNADIELFVRASMARIRRQHNLPESWPDDVAIAYLVDMASGQFIYARTVIRWVETQGKYPEDQLQQVLRMRTGTENTRPLETLDDLYTLILESGPEPHRAAAYIKAAMIAFTPPYDMNNGQMKRFLEHRIGETEFLLSSMSSLLKLTPDSYCNGIMELYHKSFLEYLQDRRRCRGLYEDETKYVHECFIRLLLESDPGHVSDDNEAPIWGFLIDMKEIYRLDFIPPVESLSKLAECDAYRWGMQLANYLARDLENAAPLGLHPIKGFMVRTLLHLLFDYAHRAACSGLTHHPACAKWTRGIIKAVADIKALTKHEGRPMVAFGKLGRLYAWDLPSVVSRLWVHWAREDATNRLQRHTEVEFKRIYPTKDAERLYKRHLKYPGRESIVPLNGLYSRTEMRDFIEREKERALRGDM